MMRKFVALAAAGTVLALASPAAAQYYPQPGYGYGSNQYLDNIRGLQRRIYNVLNSVSAAPYDQQYRLRAEAIHLDRQLRYAARNGLSPYEAEEIGTRVQRLEFQLQRASGNGRYGYGRYNGYNGYYGDRDRYGYRGNRDRDDDDNDDD